MMRKIKVNLDVRRYMNEAYIPLLKCKTRFMVLMGGSGSGKSRFICQYLIVKALKYSGRRILVIRKFNNKIYESVFKLFKEQLKQWKLLNSCKVNESTYKITLPNGSEIIFMGVDDGAETLKSITDIHDVWVEEATEIDLDTFTQIDLRIRARVENSQIICSYNPTSKKNWVYKYWHVNRLNDPDVTLLKTTYKDNRFLPESYIKTLDNLCRTNPLYERIYKYGEFASLEPTIYSNWKVESCQGKQDNIYMGLDAGYTDPTAIIKISVDMKNRKIYVLDDWQKTEATVDEIAAAIKEIDARHVVFCDSNEPRLIAGLKQKGIRARPVKKGADSVVAGIRFLQSFEIIVDPICKSTISALDDYRWMKDKNGETIEKPLHNEASHMMDALRYAIEVVQLNHKPKFLPKGIFGL